jgi:hypothetical protein
VKVLAAALGIVLVVLIPLAHGSPIDPSTPGFWDNGDFDDVIVLLTSYLQLVEGPDVPALSPSEAAVRDVAEHPVGAAAGACYEPGGPRSPPIA